MGDQPGATSKTKKWYDNRIYVVGLLIIFFPVGLYALWRSRRFSRPAKVLLTIATVVFVANIGSDEHDETKCTAAKSPVPAKQAQKKPSPTPDPQVELRKLETDLRRCEQRLEQLTKNHPRVRIHGEIKDRERDSLLLWGTAIPLGEDVNAFGGLIEEGNILVRDPVAEAMLGGRFYSGGIHYFHEKTKGRNAFGVEVPVWVYGGMPPEMAREQRNRERLVREIRRFRRLAALSAEERQALDTVATAIRNGDTSTIEAELSKTPSIAAGYTYDGTGDITLLQLACKEGNLLAVKSLVNHGAEVNARDDLGRTALHYALLAPKRTHQLEIVTYLVEKGADVNAKAGQDQTTPLQIAAMMRPLVSLDVIRFLVSQGADVNEGDSSGCTPLHYAAMEGDAELAAYLLAEGEPVRKGGVSRVGSAGRPAFGPVA